MARKKKGRDISGWLVVDKPAGPTSTAVVNKVRWAFDARKAGHAGTLDPEATGLLAVALGEATKTVPFVTDAMKAYEFTVRWGQATNTDDAEGEVIATSDLRPTDDEIKAALGRFVGDIEQVPPQFSAVKIDGERAYKLARGGEEVEIAARPLWVEELLLTDRPDADTAVLEMTCGKGGYVRAIARDLGAVLGCHGHVVRLRRIWSGPFDLDEAVTLDRIEDLARTPEIDALLLPLETGLHDLPELRCGAESLARLRNGNPAEVIGSGVEFGDTAWVSHDGVPVAVGEYRGGKLHPSRVFVTG
ncbi:MAG: tRNA pseudouridine(55) synthase TruB [Rhodobacteraceae bacterium]|nr:MAG: tRNA pseudouridine(55) synthase TruB [Paracoccaceae bacterium]